MTMVSPGKTRRSLCALSAALALVVGAAGQAAAAGELRLVRSGIAHDTLFDLDFDGAQGLAAGTFGSILVSDDGGATWRAVAAPGGEAALLGTAISAGRCLAVGQGGSVLVADDCRNWQVAASGTEARLMAVALNRGRLAYAVGAFGTVLRSTDGGHRWTAVAIDWSTLSPSGAEPHLYGVHVADDGTVTLVGEFGLILRSGDGVAWQVAHRGEQSLFGLVVAGDKAYAVGQGGVVLASRDQGASWRPLTTGSTAILTGVWSDGQARVVAAGLNTVLESIDGGVAWRRVDAGAYAQAAHAAVAAGAAADGSPRVQIVGSAAMVLELTR